MLDVLPLRFCDGLGVGRREWVVGHRPLIFNVRHRVDKDPLSLGQAENDGVVLGGDDGRFLPIDNAGGLVTIFGEQDLHVLERVDGAALGHGCARCCGQWTLICEKIRHNDVIDALRTSS